MRKRRRAKRLTPGASNVIPGAAPCQDFTKGNKDLDLQLAAWKLLSRQILFFFALTLSACLCVSSLIVLTGAFSLQLQIGAGVYLAAVGMALLRFLLGATPPLTLLVTELVKVLTAHKRVNPLE
jgi:cytochrome c biogenesis protein CcdA